MHREPVTSSSVAWVGYVASTQLLVLGFVSGSVYEFVGVPAPEHRALMSAQSKGRQFALFIKGRYAHRRVHAESSWN